VLRRIFGQNRDEVTGGWKKLLNEELQNLYSSLGIVRMMEINEDEMGREFSRHGRMKTIYRNFVGEPRR
jgi:TPP-dependent pyruvate/acetoin dehydrogenase alpha subunit